MTAALPRGNAANADAQIGTVNVKGELKSTSIVAGVAAGPDGLFGTEDDFALGGTAVTNAARVVSKIARIIIGQVLAGTSEAGFEAQHVQSVVINQTPFSLKTGSGNDSALKPNGTLIDELQSGSKIRAFEVPVV